MVLTLPHLRVTLHLVSTVILMLLCKMLIDPNRLEHRGVVRSTKSRDEDRRVDMFVIEGKGVVVKVTLMEENQRAEL